MVNRKPENKALGRSRNPPFDKIPDHYGAWNIGPKAKDVLLKVD